MKSRTTLVLIAAAFIASTALVIAAQLTTLLDGATAIGNGTSYTFQQGVPYRAHVAVLSGASAVSATVVSEGSNDNQNWVTINTINLTATSSVAASVDAAPYLYERGNVTSISGVGASVKLQVGI